MKALWQTDHNCAAPPSLGQLKVQANVERREPPGSLR
jgi:hypothetical protein